MPSPQVGDILIRNTANDMFLLTDVVTGKHLAGPLKGYMLAVDAARMRGARAIWQQNVDARGRALGELFKLPEQPGL
jgi:hypothetical protein